MLNKEDLSLLHCLKWKPGMYTKEVEMVERFLVFTDHEK